MSNKKRTSAEIRAQIDELKNVKLKELRAEERRAKRREAAIAAAEQKAADRKEADALLKQLRSYGVPIGKSIEFVNQLKYFGYGQSNEPLLPHVIASLDNVDTDVYQSEQHPESEQEHV